MYQFHLTNYSEQFQDKKSVLMVSEITTLTLPLSVNTLATKKLYGQIFYTITVEFGYRRPYVVPVKTFFPAKKITPPKVLVRKNR